MKRALDEANNVSLPRSSAASASSKKIYLCVETLVNLRRYLFRNEGVAKSLNAIQTLFSLHERSTTEAT